MAIRLRHWLSFFLLVALIACGADHTISVDDEYGGGENSPDIGYTNNVKITFWSSHPTVSNGQILHANSSNGWQVGYVIRGYDDYGFQLEFFAAEQL